MNKLQEKNLLCDVFDAFYYDDKDNLVFYSDNLTVSDIKGNADEKEVRNGKGNGLFAKLYSNKKIEISLKTNAFDFSTLALLAGTEIGTGKGTCYTPIVTLTVKAKKITLPYAPKDSKKLEVFVKDAKIENDKYKVETNNVIFTSGVNDDDEVRILPYEFDMPSQEDSYQEITVGANDFPSAGKLILKGIERDKKTKFYKDLTIIIPQAQPAADFSISTSSQVEAAETEIKLSALVENGKLMKVIESPHIEQNNGIFQEIPKPPVPISDLKAVSNESSKITLMFPAIGVGATAKVKYREKGETTFKDVVVGGTTEIRIANSITTEDTSKNVLGLTGGKKYEFKLVVTGGAYAGESNIAEALVSMPINDLKAVSSVATKVSLTFTAIGSDATAKIQYKEKSETAFKDVIVGGTTGVRIANSITTEDTSKVIEGLTTGKEYEFKLVVTGGTRAGNSNVATTTVK